MKFHVKRLFNNATKTYDESADIQRIAADKLAEGISIADGIKVLEIGSGSGLFTSNLIEKTNPSFFAATDIAFAMLKHLKQAQGMDCVNTDGEALSFKEKSFDMIAGASTLQWFENPSASIPGLLGALKPGGSFHFSIFCEGTFQEMDLLSRLTGFGSVYSMRKPEYYEEILSETRGVSFESETLEHVLYYPDVRTFLKKHKQTGAAYTGRKSVTGKGAYRRFCELYEEYFAENGKIPVTFRILYLHGRLL